MTPLRKRRARNTKTRRRRYDVVVASHEPIGDFSTNVRCLPTREEMERTGHDAEKGYDAEKRHKQTDQAGREGKFVPLVAEFRYELLLARSSHVPRAL